MKNFFERHKIFIIGVLAGLGLIFWKELLVLGLAGIVAWACWSKRQDLLTLFRRMKNKFLQ